MNAPPIFPIAHADCLRFEQRDALLVEHRELCRAVHCRFANDAIAHYISATHPEAQAHGPTSIHNAALEAPSAIMEQGATPPAQKDTTSTVAHAHTIGTSPSALSASGQGMAELVEAVQRVQMNEEQDAADTHAVAADEPPDAQHRGDEDWNDMLRTPLPCAIPQVPPGLLGINDAHHVCGASSHNSANTKGDAGGAQVPTVSHKRLLQRRMLSCLLAPRTTLRTPMQMPQQAMWYRNKVLRKALFSAASDLPLCTQRKFSVHVLIEPWAPCAQR